MKVKIAIVLLSTLTQRAVLAGSTSTRLGRTAQDAGGGDGEKQTNHLRKTKNVRGKSIAIQYGKTIDENDSPSFTPGLRALRGEDDSENWNRGSYAVASKSGSIKLNVPKDTQVGDTLFLFLR